LPTARTAGGLTKALEIGDTISAKVDAGGTARFSRSAAQLACRAIIRDHSRMKPSDALETQREAIRRIVVAHRARNPRVFGSVARGEDTEGSDLDLLVDPTPETSLLDIGAIRHELLILLGIPVDVLTPKALPEKFRSTVIAEARPV